MFYPFNFHVDCVALRSQRGGTVVTMLYQVISATLAFMTEFSRSELTYLTSNRFEQDTGTLRRTSSKQKLRIASASAFPRPGRDWPRQARVWRVPTHLRARHVEPILRSRHPPCSLYTTTTGDFQLFPRPAPWTPATTGPLRGTTTINTRNTLRRNSQTATHKMATLSSIPSSRRCRCSMAIRSRSLSSDNPRSSFLPDQASHPSSSMRKCTTTCDRSHNRNHEPFSRRS